MSIEQDKTLIRRFGDLINAHDVDGATSFSQNALTLGAIIDRLRTAAMPWGNRRQTLLVETGDPLGDRITSTAPGSMRRFRVVLAICHG